MPEFLTKPITRTQQIRDLDTWDKVPFTLEEYNYIRSLVSGLIASEYPLRVYTVSKKNGTTEVTRLEDAAI